MNSVLLLEVGLVGLASGTIGGLLTARVILLRLKHLFKGLGE